MNALEQNKIYNAGLSFDQLQNKERLSKNSLSLKESTKKSICLTEKSLEHI